MHTFLGNWLMGKLLMCKARKLRRKTSLWRWFMVLKHVGKTLKVNGLKPIHIDKEHANELVYTLRDNWGHDGMGKKDNFHISLVMEHWKCN